MRVEDCLTVIFNWMSANKLKLNPTKTTVLFISKNPDNSPDISISFEGNDIAPAQSSRILGVLFDSSFNLSSHISEIVKSCHFHMKQIRSLRRYLSPACIKQLVISLVISRLDFANSILINLPKAQLNKLQWIQNATAHLATGSSWDSDSQPLLRRLHWLPVYKRIAFKVLIHVHRAIGCDGPLYLQNLIKLKVHTLNTRQSTTKFLEYKKFK